MASNNETIADIVAQIRAAAHIQNADSPRDVLKFADRIESAHKRELAAKDDERLTIVAIYENVIAAKDREIAELRECLKEAIREKCPFTRMSCRYGEQCDYECGTQKWRNALKGAKDGE